MKIFFQNENPFTISPSHKHLIANIYVNMAYVLLYDT